MITTDKTQLNINVLTQEQYEQAKADEILDADSLYMTPEEVGKLVDVIPIENGGTGETSVAGVLQNLGLNDIICYYPKDVIGYTFTANQYRSISVPYTEFSGYIPILYNVSCITHSAIRVFNFYTSGSNVVFEAINQGTTSVTANFILRFLYIKSTIVGSLT